MIQQNKGCRNKPFCTFLCIRALRRDPQGAQKGLSAMKILFTADISGKVGRRMAAEGLFDRMSREDIDISIANAENAAGGLGITREVYEELSRAGYMLFTMGNHTFDKKEAESLFHDNENIIRPANYPAGTPGKGMEILTARTGQKVAVINLMGRAFLDQRLSSPFETADALIEEARRTTPVIFVDFHAEATAEKVALGRYLDGRVTAVIGTHTHIQTADEVILPGGTAYLTDAGMTGPEDSCLGMKVETAINRFLGREPKRFETAKGKGQWNGVLIQADPETGKAVSIIRINEKEESGRYAL